MDDSTLAELIALHVSRKLSTLDDALCLYFGRFSVSVSTNCDADCCFWYNLLVDLSIRRLRREAFILSASPKASRSLPTSISRLFKRLIASNGSESRMEILDKANIKFSHHTFYGPENLY